MTSQARTDISVFSKVGQSLKGGIKENDAKSESSGPKKMTRWEKRVLFYFKKTTFAKAFVELEWVGGAMASHIHYITHGPFPN